MLNKKKNKTEARAAQVKPDLIKIRIDRQLYIAIKLLFKNRIASYKMMNIVCREYIARHKPSVLDILDYE